MSTKCSKKNYENEKLQQESKKFYKIGQVEQVGQVTELASSSLSAARPPVLPLSTKSTWLFTTWYLTDGCVESDFKRWLSFTPVLALVGAAASPDCLSGCSNTSDSDGSSLAPFLRLMAFTRLKGDLGGQQQPLSLCGDSCWFDSGSTVVHSNACNSRQHKICTTTLKI